jgi:hypothetical protein
MKRADQKKIKIEEVKALVVNKTITHDGRTKLATPRILIDSFVVMSINKPNNDLYFAKVVCDKSKLKLYFKILPPVVNRGATMASNMYVSPSATSTPSSFYYGGIALYYERDNITYKINGKNYKAILSEAFADIPSLVARLDVARGNEEIESIMQNYIDAKKQLVKH